MPFVDLEQIDPTTPVDRPKMPVTPGALDVTLGSEAPQAPSFGKTIGAAFRYDNLVGSMLSQENMLGLDGERVDPWSLVKGSKYESHFDSFAGLESAGQVDAMKRQIDREVEDQRTLGSAPWYMSVPAQIMAGTLDLPTLIPGGAFVRGTKGGFSIARTGLSTAAGGAVGIGAQEAGLQMFDETRTGAESALNIGAGTLLAGMLGAGVARLLNPREFAGHVARLDAELKSSTALTDPFTTSPVPASLGAAAVGGRDLAEMSIAGTGAAALARATSKLNPALRILHSPVPEVRETGLNLFENTLYLRGNDTGLATPTAVETLRKEWDAGLASATKDTNTAFSQYKQSGGRLNRDEFRQEVGRAMRRSDAGDDPFVTQAAQSWRKSVFDPLKDAAVEAKLLPADVGVETASSYFSRMWNRRKLIADEGEAKSVFANYIHESAPRWLSEFESEAAAKLNKAEQALTEGRTGGKDTTTLERKLADLQTEINQERDARFGSDDLTRSRAEDIAKEVWDRLTGRAGEGPRPEFFNISSRGPLKGRTFKIPDELVERWLESDVGVVGRRYQRIMSADVELARKFGSPDMRDQIKGIKDGYDRLRAETTDPKQLMQIRERERSDISDLEGVRDLIRGTFEQSKWEHDFGHIVRMANAFNYLRSMGQVVLSSLTDAPRAAMAHGMLNFMGDAFGALKNLDAAKLSAKEAKLAGNINDRILSHRMATIAEITDPYSGRNAVERFMDNMTNVASMWNGIRLWTDSMKSMSAVTVQNRMLRAAENFEGSTKADKRWLAFLGIDQSMAERIAKEFAEHGQNVEGVRVAGTQNWTDEVARRTYRAALNKDLDSLIVTKSVADVPLFAATPTGKMILQFNTFNLASHQRILLRGLQEGPTRFLSGVVSMTSLGMLMTYLSAVAGNRADKLPSFTENPGWWIAEGLDRSGIFNVPFQVSNAVEKLTGMNPIKAPMKLGDQGTHGSERARNRNELGSVLGPTAGVIQDIGAVAGIPGDLIKGKDLTQGQKNAMERLVPFNSYAGVRSMLRYFVNPPAN